MANKAFDYYKELPSWAKGAVVVGVLGVTYIFASQIIKRIRQQAEDAKSRASLKNAETELKDLIKSGVAPTFPKSQFDAWAGQIQKQFEGCDFSATYHSSALPLASNSFLLVEKIIKQIKNNSDWLSLISAFGVRTYEGCMFYTTVSGDLPKCIVDELSSQEIDVLNKLLTTKGISYKL